LFKGPSAECDALRDDRNQEADESGGPFADEPLGSGHRSQVRRSELQI